MTPAPSDDRADLLHLVTQVLADREAAYPKHVADGTMTAEDADKGLRVMRAIVADWRRLVELRNCRPCQPLDTSATDVEKLDVVTYIHDRALAIRAKFALALRENLASLGLLDNIESAPQPLADLASLYRTNAKGWPLREIGLYLSAVDRSAATEELLWYTTHWPRVMMVSERQAERAARDQKTKAA